MDSAILIRTADIRSSDLDTRAHVEVGVGATLVRNSDPASEVAETRTKAAGLISALGAAPRLDRHPQVQEALRQRNSTIASFWLSDGGPPAQPRTELVGRRALIIDAEDTFTSMLGHQLRAIGLTVQLTRFDADHALDDFDLVVAGPGPGDPRDADHPKMSRLSATIETLLARRSPFMAVCLSHQLLCRQLGFELIRKPVPSQGTQRQVDLFGSVERVGFYNSYVARAGAERFNAPGIGEVQVSLDPATGEVHALRGPHFSSVQFHLESVLTQDAESILSALLLPLMETREVLSA